MRIVSCDLMGGLGNQLFQIFTTLAYCFENKFKCVFPYSEILHVGVPRPTYWHTLLNSLRFFTTNNGENRYTNEALATFPKYREPAFGYKRIPSFLEPQYHSLFELTLFGYYQSYKYFASMDRMLFSLIGLTEQLSDIQTEYASLFTANCLISMHFRLGDYKYKTSHHPIMSYEYYKNALDYVVSNQSPGSQTIRVLYFCEQEDNDYVSGMIDQLRELYKKVEFQKVDDKIVDWKQLLIMSSCHHNIIANSSFSWWGAYFNQLSSKIVCYPSVWFGPGMGNVNTDDLFPPSWHKI